MPEQFVYCDHSHEIDLIRDNDQVENWSDTWLNPTGNNLELSLDNYDNDQDEVAQYLKQNGSIYIKTFSCPYCAALDKYPSNNVGFLTELSVSDNPPGVTFTRLRYNGRNWTKDPVVSNVEFKDSLGVAIWNNL